MKSVVVTDSVLKRLVLDRRMQQKLPFLTDASKRLTTGGCRKCRKRKPVASVAPEALAEVRRRLYRAPPEQLQAAKNFLGADRLVFYFDGQPGYPQRTTL